MDTERAIGESEDWAEGQFLSVKDVLELVERMVEVEEMSAQSLTELVDEEQFWSAQVGGEALRDMVLSRAVSKANTEGEFEEILNEFGITPEEAERRIRKFENLGRPSKVQKWANKVEEGDATIMDATDDIKSPGTLNKLKDELEDRGILEKKKSEAAEA